MELIKLLGLTGFMIFSDLRLPGSKGFIFGRVGTGWQYLLWVIRTFKNTIFDFNSVA